MIITIVVLLILAGVSINLVLGENGLIAKAKETRNATKEDNENMLIGMNNLYDEMEAAISGTTPPKEDVLSVVHVNQEALTKGTINGKAASSSNPIIPAGYIPVNTEDAKWDAATGPEYNNGLVITDEVDEEGNSIGNEWVWVPVPVPSVMYETANPAIELTGGEGKTYLSGVEVEKYSKSGIVSGVTRGLPNNTGSPYYREPDVVVSVNGISYDANGTNRATAGFTKTDGTTMTLAEMAQTMVDEYETMIESIEEYKGFYIGRYELTANGSKAGETLTNSSWYTLYANCKNLSVSEDAMTRMIWGCQWDVVCNWLANAGYSITDSSKWGNYRNYNTANGYEEGDEKYEAGAGSKKNTGSSENWKANNIYDFAGNCEEWSQEAVGSTDRDRRGGYFEGNSSFYPAIYRTNDFGPTYQNSSSLRFSSYSNSATLILNKHNKNKN